MPPKVSVVIPVYNVGKQLEKCLDSVVAQTFPRHRNHCRQRRQYRQLAGNHRPICRQRLSHRRHRQIQRGTCLRP